MPFSPPTIIQPASKDRFYVITTELYSLYNNDSKIYNVQAYTKSSIFLAKFSKCRENGIKAYKGPALDFNLLLEHSSCKRFKELGSFLKLHKKEYNLCEKNQTQKQGYTLQQQLRSKTHGKLIPLVIKGLNNFWNQANSFPSLTLRVVHQPRLTFLVLCQSQLMSVLT